MEVHGSQAVGEPRGARRSQGAARAGDPGGAGAAPAPHGASRQRDRAPEADADAARSRAGRPRQGHGQRAPGAAPHRRGDDEGRHREGARVPAGRGVVRQPPHRARERGRGAQGHAARRHAERRCGQECRAEELVRVAEEAQRTSASALAARPGEDAGADEQGDVAAHRDRRRGRPDVRGDPREDRGPHGPGRGHGRSPGVVRRIPHDGSRAGADQCRSAVTPVAAAHPARPACPGVRGRDRARPPSPRPSPPSSLRPATSRPEAAAPRPRLS